MKILPFIPSLTHPQLKINNLRGAGRGGEILTLFLNEGHWEFFYLFFLLPGVWYILTKFEAREVMISSLFIRLYKYTTLCKSA